MAYDAVGEALKVESLSTQEKVTLIVLSHRANKHKNYTCYPSIKTLQNECSLSRAAIYKSIQSLIEKELIEKIKTKYREEGAYKLLFIGGADGSSIKPTACGYPVDNLSLTETNNTSLSPTETGLSPQETSYLIYKKKIKNNIYNLNINNTHESKVRTMTRFSENDYSGVAKVLNRLSLIDRVFNGPQVASALVEHLLDKQVNPMLALEAVRGFNKFPNYQDIHQRCISLRDGKKAAPRLIEGPSKYAEEFQACFLEWGATDDLERKQELYEESRRLGSLMATEGLRNHSKPA